MSVLSLKHHLKLLPALFTWVFGLGVNVEGFKEVDCVGIKGFLLIGLVLDRGSEFQGYYWGLLLLDVNVSFFVCDGGNLSIKVQWYVHNLTQSPLEVMGHHRRISPATTSLVINTDSTVLTLAVPNLASCMTGKKLGGWPVCISMDHW